MMKAGEGPGGSEIDDALAEKKAWRKPPGSGICGR